MSETIAKTGVKRDNSKIYYIKGGNVWASPLKKPGQPKGKAEEVWKGPVQTDYSKYMYYVGTGSNDELTVERTDRQVGGSKRAKKAKSAPAKKAAKKPAKKAAAKKTGGGKKGGKKGKRK